MRWRSLIAVSSAGALFLASTVFAYGPAYYNRSTDTKPQINWTFYAPGAGGIMQGSMSAAYPDPSGQRMIHTLDDVRTGRSRFVTLASASSMKGRWFCIGTVVYTSPTNNGGDGQTHTLENVVGYVHDTGCAFNGTCSFNFLPQFSGGSARPDKIDIPVGNFTGWGGGVASQYVSRNRNSAQQPQAIAGPPSGDEKVGACGGEPIELGLPTVASYRPSSYQDQSPLNSLFSSAPVGFPIGITGPTSIGGTPGQIVTQPTECLTSINPPIIQQIPAGSVYPSNCLSQPSNSPLMNPAYRPPPLSSTNPTSVGGNSTQGQPITNPLQLASHGQSQPSTVGPPGPPPAPQALLLAQPLSVTRGNPVLVAWSSVGISASAPCTVTENGSVLASGNSGSNIITTNALPLGVLAFDLKCGTLERTVNVTVQ